MEHLYATEDRDGVRFTWNVWPCNSVDSKKLIAPIACMYSPFKRSETLPIVNYDPVSCNSCHAFLNPYSRVDLNTNLWSCPFCFQRNKLPPVYNGISAISLPAELHSTSTTIEYALASGSGGLAPVFVFAIDICLPRVELECVKKSLLQLFPEIPSNCYIGLITYGATVNVYELSFQHCPKTHVFDGNREYTPTDVQQILSLGSSVPGGGIQHSIRNKYILPISQVEATLTAIVEDLYPDPTPAKPDHRPQRCSGTAVSVALSLLEFTFARSGARVIVLGGGPATSGPGLVIGTEIKEQMRSHTELNKEQAKHVHKATKFYTTLAERAAKNSHAVDIFSCSLDQTGILEMQDLPKKTGGVIVTSETFQHEQFKRSFLKLFEKDDKNYLKMGFNARIEIKTSRELAICGGIGHMSNGFNKTGNLSDTEVGLSRTSEWKMATLDPSSSFAFFFEVTNPRDTQIPSGNLGMIQFKTTYTHPSGQSILRVTTLAYNWAPTDAEPSGLLPGFDQEACAALIARLAVYKADSEDIDIIRWVDKHLIRFCRRYCSYQKNNEQSLQMPQEMGLYPQFMFHFRRCPLTNVFGSSPDETVFYRHYLMRESVSNILTMIQPSLDQYALGSEESLPVLLSSNSLKNEVILVLDTFFHVVVWSGDTLVKWIKAGYHEKPEYSHLKQLTQTPLEDVMGLLENRFPYPLHVICDQGSSAARYLLAVVDPAPSTASALKGGEVVNTEDASLQRFIEHLKRFAVQNE